MRTDKTDRAVPWARAPEFGIPKPFGLDPLYYFSGTTPRHYLEYSWRTGGGDYTCHVQRMIDCATFFVEASRSGFLP